MCVRSKELQRREQLPEVTTTEILLIWGNRANAPIFKISCVGCVALRMAKAVVQIGDNDGSGLFRKSLRVLW